MSLQIALYARDVKRSSVPFLEELMLQIRNSGAGIVLFEALAETVAALDGNTEEISVFSDHVQLNRYAPDFLITLGGDGTILEAATIVRDARIPILGINLGRLGFLADVAKTEISRAVQALLEEDYDIVERSLIELESDPSVLEIDFPYALNEVTTERKDSTSMVSVDTFIDSTFLTTYWADGLIVATPTGSTGYSLSCGGPIMMPQSRNFVLTPIAPHNLNVRPFVIPDNQEIELIVESRKRKVQISMDSRIYQAPSGCSLKLRKAGFSLASVQLKDLPFSSTLRSKLFWGVDRRN